MREEGGGIEGGGKREAGEEKDGHRLVNAKIYKCLHRLRTYGNENQAFRYYCTFY